MVFRTARMTCGLAALYGGMQQRALEPLVRRGGERAGDFEVILSVRCLFRLSPAQALAQTATSQPRHQVGSTRTHASSHSLNVCP